MNLSFNICVVLGPLSAARLNPNPSNAWAPHKPSATPLPLNSLIPCLPSSDSTSYPQFLFRLQTLSKPSAFVHSHNSHFCGLGQREAQAQREQVLKLHLTEQIKSCFHSVWFKVSCLACSTRERHWWSSIWCIICTAVAPGIFMSVSPMNLSLSTKRQKQDLLRIMRTVLISQTRCRWERKK